MTSLSGMRVLVVEDEGPIAMMIEDMLAEMGCVVAGTAASVRDALAAVAAGGFDFALLDLNLAGVSAEGVAEALVAAGVPFAFVSGYGQAGISPHLRGWPVIQKPFFKAEVEKILRAARGG